MNIQNLLHRISDINKKYEQFAKLSGDNFNVFSVLGLNSAENMHSLFIAELLNPNGTHGQGCLYLSLFLQELDLIKSYKELNSAKVTTEKHIGEIDKDYLEGGRIDIFIEHVSNNIIIENKIYAGDQYNQLYRYYQFGKKHFDNPLILYLTLDGSEPSSESLGELTLDKVTCISYAKHIISWLNVCIEKSASLSIIRETLIQYRNIIKKLTNQCSSKDKEMEINDILLVSEDNFNSAKQISNVMESIYKLPDNVVTKLRESYKEKYGSHFFTLCTFDKVYTVNLQVVYEGYDRHFQLGIVPLENGKWPHQGQFKWQDIEEFNNIQHIAHKYLEKIYKESNYKKIKGYYYGQNYLCCIPFQEIDKQSFSFTNPNFNDYKWLSDQENQRKLTEYALNLCNDFIQFLKKNTKDQKIEFCIS